MLHNMYISAINLASGMIPESACVGTSNICHFPQALWHAPGNIYFLKRLRY